MGGATPARIQLWPKRLVPDRSGCVLAQVVHNCRSLADALMKKGYKLVTDGTDNHLILWDLRPEGVTGSKMEKACDLCHITLNKNAVVGDLSAMNPGGVRIGECSAPRSSSTCGPFLLCSMHVRAVSLYGYGVRLQCAEIVACCVHVLLLQARPP